MIKSASRLCWSRMASKTRALHQNVPSAGGSVGLDCGKPRVKPAATKAEETVFKALVAAGFTRGFPQSNPTEPPADGTFWCNARVFDAMRDQHNLEADFIIGLRGKSVWLELHGEHHYMETD